MTKNQKKSTPAVDEVQNDDIYNSSEKNKIKVTEELEGEMNE